MRKQILSLMMLAMLAGCGSFGFGGKRARAPEYTPLRSQADFQQFMGRPLAFDRGDGARDGHFIVIEPNGRLSGNWDGLPVGGSYEIIDGRFCRDLTIGSRKFDTQCQRFAKQIDAERLQVTRPNGQSFFYSY